eukprot:m.72328 g.72328  ORF g.72328 m.72328 type:complete len:542 (-) comp10106_c0_seq1:76-1701(-)
MSTAILGKEPKSQSAPPSLQSTPQRPARRGRRSPVTHASQTSVSTAAIWAISIIFALALVIEVVTPLAGSQRARKAAVLIPFVPRGLTADRRRTNFTQSYISDKQSEDEDVRKMKADLAEARRTAMQAEREKELFAQEVASLKGKLEVARAALDAKRKEELLQITKEDVDINGTTPEWILPRHLDEYFSDHTPDEYVAKVQSCEGHLTFKHGKRIHAKGNGALRQHFDFFQTFAKNWSNNTAILGFETYDFKKQNKWPCFVYSTYRPYAASAFLTYDEIALTIKAANPAASKRYPQNYLIAGAETPWEDRIKTPTWRGSLWTAECGENHVNINGTLEDHLACMEKMAPRSSAGFGSFARLAAIMYSLDHPKKLDAKIGGIPYNKDYPFWEHNKTNSIHKILPPSPIEPSKYFGKYQTHLVLGGIGAAFRLTQTFESGTAVVLEEYPVEIWYTRFLQPYVHYIPLAYGAKNLSETLDWIEHHPGEVKQIAANGRRFYDVNLSPDMRLRATDYLLSRLDRFLSAWSFDPVYNTVKRPQNEPST